MTVGRKTLRSIRLRRETSNGSRAVPRYLWRGNGELIKDEREVVNPEEQVGISGGTDRTYIPKLIASLELAETEATYEQIADVLTIAGLGTMTAVQGSAQGASGSAVLFMLNVPTTTFPYTHSVTAEAGDNVEAQVAPYCIATEVSLSFAGGEAVKVTATLAAQYGTRTNASGSYSAEGTLVRVETILASNGTFYLDPATSGAAAYGAGLVTSGNILGGELTIAAQFEPKYWVDGGVLYPGTFVLTGHEITGNLMLEHQVSGTYGAAGSAGQIEKWRQQDPQLLRMNWPGGTIPVGTTYQNKLFRVDLPIKWTTLQDYGDQNGNAIVTGEFMSKYNELAPQAGRGTFWVVRHGTSEFMGA